MKALWNETTAKILATLADREGRDVIEISKKIKTREGNASTILLRLLRQGHVTREWVEDGKVLLGRTENGDVTRSRYVFFYTITKKGLKKLARVAGESFEDRTKN